MDLNPWAIGITTLTGLLAYKYVNARIQRSKLDAIPTLGSDGIFSSYATAWRYVFHGRELIEEGCKQYPGTAFKVPTLFGWNVVLNGRDMFEELKRASEDDLSVLEVFEDLVHLEYTVSPIIHKNPYHIDVIRTTLTRNIAARFDEVRDEIQAAFSELIPLQDDWVEPPNIIKTIQDIVVRTSNRFFVGLPLCRNEDWCDMNLKFTINVMINGALIGFFPKFLHPIVGRIITNRKSSVRRAVRHLIPILDERFAMEREYGRDWPDKPNDLISWLIDSCAQNGEDWQKGSYEDLALRLIATNFVAIHTTSQTFTQALFHLAANPQIIGPLREEIKFTVEREGGWSKLAMVQMRLLDSFMKESQRRIGVPPVGITRIALKDYRFSNGVVIPAGTKVGVPSYHIHHDEATYPSPLEFNPTRFSELREKEGEGIKHHMVTPTSDYLTFGAGKHACPGRFFAVNEIKALLAHVLMNYDIKLRDSDVFPEEIEFAGFITPNQNAKVLFRKRRDL
ncbi:cytochrome P450 [Marasmius fiardii PR-910]|nr:cytochrome P450 [Marasmius fiardii PR-910]